MLKDISNLGKTLNKIEQLSISGGFLNHNNPPLPCSSTPTYSGDFCYICGQQFHINSANCN